MPEAAALPQGKPCSFRRHVFTSCPAFLGLLALLSCGGGGGGSTAITNPASATVSPNSLTFAEQVTGTASAAQTVTISNTGGATLTISGITTSTNFTGSTNCGSSLGIGSSCTANVNFSPGTTATGPQTGTLTISSNVAQGSLNVSLSGTGIQPSGMVTSTTTACGSGSPATDTCYTLHVTCPNISDEDALLEVSPTATTPPTGTVLLGTGVTGSNLYTVEYTYGSVVVSDLTQAGFTTAQIAFNGADNGWLQGPSPDGPRSTACRYVAVAQWVYQNIHQSNTSAPYCLHGVSGGAGNISYGLADYGLDSIVAMAEVASGPPFGRLDHACLCDRGAQDTSASTCPNAQPISECYEAGSKLLVDASYGDSRCTDEITSDSTLFVHDSNASEDANLSYPKTFVNFIFGGLDMSSAKPLGLDYATEVKSNHAITCAADDVHPIPNALDGAQQIANDLITLCKLQ
jgi:hypothetical protein